MHRAIYLSNSANQDFQAIIIPSGAWEWSQIWSLEACRAWSSMSAIQTTHDFYKWYKSASTGEWTPEWAKNYDDFHEELASFPRLYNFDGNRMKLLDWSPVLEGDSVFVFTFDPKR